MTKLKTIFFAASALALLGVSACKDPSDGTGGGTGAPPDAPFVEGGASLILSPDKLDITVKGTTADGTSVTVEGCTETTLISGIETVLHAKGSLVILKGKITSLDCSVNRLNSLNVQGLTALQVLSCVGNRLTELNVQGLTALKELVCWGNQLNSLNVQGLTALQVLNCFGNRLTELNVQGLTALQVLNCSGNRLTALNVQGLIALQTLNCFANQLTALNVQGLTALKELLCGENQLNADAFKKLFNDLPVRAYSDNASCYLYTERTDDTEGNHTYFSAPPDLSDAFNNAKTVKKWKMYKVDADGYGVRI
ncbi:leucine-rich repeat domain-containing protein [Treponema sp. Marseille-Q4132]|uniref:leucine-rich repeat domain-containing protein n=1 Tax=Treponema sp. Marseille-Q4132 TaxID=2766701 RepID=UPI001652D1CB|nr:leucine-rich repeat domain-containing protein [Treponema sp. Marseille-Q4132]QNL96689.1 leucine-rich repeat domain-containing protein [Treponema sp. Marseille-Q4132]